MDELVALKILRGEDITPQPPQEEKPTIRMSREMKILIFSIIGGALLLLLIMYFIIHPVYRLALKLAMNDNYIITTKVKEDGGHLYSLREVKVDGNKMYAVGNYYEIGENESYVYEQYGDTWYRYIYNPNNGDIDNIPTEDLLNPDNYTRSFFPWAPMEYHGELMGLDNPRVQVLFGKILITGQISGRNAWGMLTYYNVTIEIGSFGLADVELPEEYKVPKY